MAWSANFEDTTKPNQSPAAGGFDSERRSSGVSARWLLMQSIKSRRKRYEACDDVAGSANFEDTTKPNQSPAAGGFDSERRSSGVSARWLLMQSIKKPSQAIQSLRRRWQGQPILRTDRNRR